MMSCKSLKLLTFFGTSCIVRPQGLSFLKMFEYQGYKSESFPGKNTLDNGTGK